MVSAPAVWKVPMMWFEGSCRIAEPQSVKRGRLRVKGILLVWQWAWLLRGDKGVEEEKEGTRSVSGGVVDVRFTGWWMGERSDTGVTARAMARVVEASAVSEMRKTLGVSSIIIVLGLCLRTMLVCKGD